MLGLIIPTFCYLMTWQQSKCCLLLFFPQKGNCLRALEKGEKWLLLCPIYFPLQPHQCYQVDEEGTCNKSELVAFKILKLRNSKKFRRYWVNHCCGPTPSCNFKEEEKSVMEFTPKAKRRGKIQILGSWKCFCWTWLWFLQSYFFTRRQCGKFCMVGIKRRWKFNLCL